MKKLLLLFITLLLISCGGNDKPEETPKNISAGTITHDMGCANCGMNLKKYISTSHAFKTKDGKPHIYCSINCSTIGLENLDEQVDDILAIDYNSTKYVNAKKAYYVIGSSLKGTMTSVSKFTFEKQEDAEEFSKTYSGKEIVGYDKALEMSRDEIAKRKK